MFNVLYKLKLLPNVICVGKVGVIQSLKLEGKGKITLDDGCVLGVYPSPNLYHGECYLEARAATAQISIGKRVYINNNAIIIADKTAITIGDDTLIGPNFICFDSNFHSLHPAKRLGSDYRCKPVTIGSNVFIGANVTILQGVSIGDNSVIGAGAVISQDVPANVIVKVGRELEFLDLK
ncbi:DapH/DapD/GlmU-related protein [Shewanella oncorhynchi]|uniref:DapH/DapD/GlmU-related protein n=1 Tax=Shewanella oncorhynchi TaxID=2726434 RepID=UPI003D791C02